MKGSFCKSFTKRKEFAARWIKFFPLGVSPHFPRETGGKHLTVTSLGLNFVCSNGYSELIIFPIELHSNFTLFGGLVHFRVWLGFQILFLFKDQA